MTTPPNKAVSKGGETAPYIAFKTLSELLDRMKNEGAPSRIDRSYLDNFSGGYITQVVAAFEFLDLLGPGGKLEPALKDLVVGDEPRRKELIGDLVRAHYGSVLALGGNATQQQMLDEFSKSWPRATGDTRRKAVAFFLKACNYAGITVSRHWKVPPAGVRTRREPRADSQGGEESGGESPPQPPTAATDAHSDTVELRSGGTVTLSVSVNLFGMDTYDRNFVLGLIDALKEYDRPKAELEAPNADDILDIVEDVADEN